MLEEKTYLGESFVKSFIQFSLNQLFILEEKRSKRELHI